MRRVLQTLLAAITLFTLTVDGGSDVPVIRGVILSMDGSPIAHATVRLFQPETTQERLQRWQSGTERNPLLSAVTNAAGAFEFHLALTGTRDLTVSADGFEPVTTRVGPDASRMLMLRSAPRVVGHVRGGAKPVAGARLIWRSGDGSEMEMVSDATGAYKGPDPRVWATSVIVLHRDWAPLVIRQPGDGDSTAFFRMPIDFDLDSGRTIAGVARFSEDEATVDGALISVDGWPVTRSSPEGTFTIEHAPRWTRSIEGRSGDRAGTADARESTVTILMRPALVLRGRVVDRSDQAPIPGAEVVVLSTAHDWPRSAFSGGDGAFEIAPLFHDDCDVRVMMPGFAFSRERIQIEPRLPDLVLRGDRLAAVIGTVRDTDERPIAGARVTVIVPAENESSFERHFIAYSADGGKFVVDAVPSGLTLRVTALGRGYEPTAEERVRLRSGERRSVELHALRAIKLTGRVLDETGRAVSGAVVSFLGHEESLPTDLAPLPATTSEDGSFEIDLARGQYDISAVHARFAKNLKEGVVVSDLSDSLTIVLRSPAEIHGVIRRGGRPAESFEVSGGKQQATTRGDGSFELNGLEPGDIVLTVRDANGFLQQKRSVPAPSFVTIDLDAAARIRGHVVDQDTRRAVRPFTVTAEVSGGGMIRVARKTFSGEDGAFDLQELPPGRIRLMVDAEGYPQTEASLRSLESGQTVEDLEIALSPPSLLHGRITDENGAGVDGASIAIFPDGQPQLSALSDSSGRYSAMVARGTATVVVDALGHQTEKISAEMRTGENRRDIRLGRGNTLRGSVVDGSGMPVAAATVAVQSSSSPKSTRTDDRGMFELSGLSRGPFIVAASRPGYAGVRRDFAGAITQPVVLVLKAAGVVAGRITGIPGGLSSSIMVTAASHDGTAIAQASPNGDFRIADAVLGEAEIVAEARSVNGMRRTRSQRVRITAEAETWVELAFDGVNVISGVARHAGAPAADADVAFRTTSTSEVLATAVTDSAGRYTALVPNGDYSIELRNRSATILCTTHARISTTLIVDLPCP